MAASCACIIALAPKLRLRPACQQVCQQAGGGKVLTRRASCKATSGPLQTTHCTPGVAIPAAVLGTGDQQVLPEDLAQLLGSSGAAACQHRCCPVLRSVRRCSCA